MRLQLFSLILMGFVVCCQSEKQGREGNRLRGATSPYLLGHADNPVNWYEWGEEALEKAERENKPIIVSIGYASCHWCHVMERESFMDTAVANYMNRHFVSIKVDREERPDLDDIYLNAAQLIHGEGGWPLNAFTLPNGKPFYAGTYFTQPQWLRLLQNIQEAYTKDYEKVRRQSENLTAEIVKIQTESGRSTDFSISNYNLAILVKDSLLSQYDHQYGGLKGSSKFPEPQQWEFLMQMSSLKKDKILWQAVENTLASMMNGGIYDALGGGFFRYTTDEKWEIPHFEKMLYDNALLLKLYAHAYQYTSDKRYEQVITEMYDWLSREMEQEDGGYFSSISADSGGDEGAFYVWKYDELKHALTVEEFDLLSRVFEISQEGNWEKSTNILFKKQDVPLMDQSEISKVKAKLYKLRSKRERPATDDKILTAWNALMIKGLTEAYQATGKDKYLHSALKTARFIEKKMLTPDLKLFRTFRQGKVSGTAFLEDYAYLADAYLALYQATFDAHWLDMSKSLVMTIDRRFLEDGNPFYVFNPTDHKKPLVPSHVVSDQILPSPIAIMAQLKFRLGKIFYDDALLLESTNLLNQMKNTISTEPVFYSSWAQLAAYDGYGFYEVAITGGASSALGQAFQRHYLPNIVVAGGNSDTIPLLKDKNILGRNMIFVCKDKVCKLPVQRVSEAIGQFRHGRPKQ
ncbi:thioredoxin domain-containing protein [Dyadobacter tibetensis]|uniref:thioredoxin domain-containing protein n=1 Tax=Dyadobacter tibetensis TaxID=1211851 RepID=UPI000470C2C0|nr:thioredoxin domain-containing protein [Dyadobacter tibetensis]